MKTNNTVWETSQITKEDRASLKRQKPFVIWLTGLSGSGKSTLADHLDAYFYSHGLHSYRLDGDNVRHGLNSDLGFDDQSRVENIRRIGEVAKILVDAGLIVIAAFISPFKEDREMVRRLFEQDEFIEVYLDATLKACEQRDVKGLYRMARAGKIRNFTGVDSPYETPLSPEIRLNSTILSIEQEIMEILKFVKNRGLLQHIDGSLSL